MVMPTVSVVITTTNFIIVRAIPTEARKILRFGAENVDTRLRKFSCNTKPNQLKSATEPVASQNGNDVAYAPLS
jgi:hypothetical protein